jgi:release factor glutamine methyltransferase
MTEEELIKKYVPKEKQKEALEKLKDNYPVQYLIGNVDFYDCNIKVNESVLIPRFETELLVDKTIKIIKSKFDNKISIIELGTGSGAISIALKKNLNCDIKAIDISNKALSLAKENAKLNNVDIVFSNHDMHIKPNGKYDVIISNPPYLTSDIKIAKPVLHEPKLALYAKDNGLEFYKSILGYAKNILNDRFLIAFEIGEEQSIKIEKIAKENLDNVIITCENDLTGKPRYIFIESE